MQRAPRTLAWHAAFGLLLWLNCCLERAGTNGTMLTYVSILFGTQASHVLCVTACLRSSSPAMLLCCIAAGVPGPRHQPEPQGATAGTPAGQAGASNTAQHHAVRAVNAAGKQQAPQGEHMPQQGCSGSSDAAAAEQVPGE